MTTDQETIQMEEFVKILEEKFQKLGLCVDERIVVCSKGMRGNPLCEFLDRAEPYLEKQEEFDSGDPYSVSHITIYRKRK